MFSQNKIKNERAEKIGDEIFGSLQNIFREIVSTELR